MISHDQSILTCVQVVKQTVVLKLVPGGTYQLLVSPSDGHKEAYLLVYAIHAVGKSLLVMMPAGGQAGGGSEAGAWRLLPAACVIH